MSLNFQIFCFFVMPLLKLQQELFIGPVVTLLCIWVSALSASLVLYNKAAILGNGW